MKLQNGNVPLRISQYIHQSEIDICAFFSALRSFYWPFALFSFFLVCISAMDSRRTFAFVRFFIQHGDGVEGSDGSLVYVDDSEEENEEQEVQPSQQNQEGVDKENKAQNAFVIVEETQGSGESGSTKIEQKKASSKKSPIAFPESRFPAKSEEIYIPNGALDYYFTMLSQVENQVEGTVARALVWGDSTIASDGIIKDVRNRMFEEFGDSGPGFLAVHVDPRWSLRRDIYRNLREVGVRTPLFMVVLLPKNMV